MAGFLELHNMNPIGEFIYAKLVVDRTGVLSG
jgi:hypothetical protein